MYTIGNVNCFEYLFTILHPTFNLKFSKTSKIIAYGSNIYEAILGLENHEKVYIGLSEISVEWAHCAALWLNYWKNNFDLALLY